MTQTRAYFGDGVYAVFEGDRIILQANGVGREATDTIYLELGMPQMLVDWQRGGYIDHNSGRTFAESLPKHPSDENVPI